MPRKVDPKWGNDGFFDVDPFILTDSQASELYALLGFSGCASKATTLRAIVDEVGTCMRHWRGRGPAAFRRDEARKALLEISNQGALNFATISQLNGRAFDCFYDALLLISPSPFAAGESPYDLLCEDKVDNEVLQEALRGAINSLEALHGADPDHDLTWGVSQLCTVYEETVGSLVTHSNKGESMGYTSESRSKAGQFVTKCFEIIDPTVSASKLSGALREYIRTRNEHDSEGISKPVT